MENSTVSQPVEKISTRTIFEALGFSLTKAYIKQYFKATPEVVFTAPAVPVEKPWDLKMWEFQKFDNGTIFKFPVIGFGSGGVVAYSMTNFYHLICDKRFGWSAFHIQRGISMAEIAHEVKIKEAKDFLKSAGFIGVDFLITKKSIIDTKDVLFPDSEPLTEREINLVSLCLDDPKHIKQFISPSDIYDAVEEILKARNKEQKSWPGYN